MKYATVMTTGLLVNISIFASDMPSTERYTDLMENKQRIIKQLSKQAECVRLANDHQQIKTCQDQFIQLQGDVTRREKTARYAQKLKTDDPAQAEFF